MTNGRGTCRDKNCQCHERERARNAQTVNAGLILGARGGLVEPLHPIVIRPVTVALCAARARGNVARRWLNA